MKIKCKLKLEFSDERLFRIAWKEFRDLFMKDFEDSVSYDNAIFIAYPYCDCDEIFVHEIETLSNYMISHHGKNITGYAIGEKGSERYIGRFRNSAFGWTPIKILGNFFYTENGITRLFEDMTCKCGCGGTPDIKEGNSIFCTKCGMQTGNCFSPAEARYKWETAFNNIRRKHNG